MINEQKKSDKENRSMQECLRIAGLGRMKEEPHKSYPGDHVK